MSAVMSNLPRQVQEMSDEADRLAGVTPPSDTPADPATPPPVEATQDPVTPAAPVAADPPEPKREDWKNRYLTLQGMFNAEVPRLNNQVKELQAQITAILAKQTQAPPPEAPKPRAPLVNEKDVETFGGDLIDLIKRQAAEMVGAEREKFQADLKQLQDENASLKKDVTTVVERQGVNARTQYETDLAKEVPDWQTVNVDPEFLKWLQVVDPMAGVPRHAFVKSAYDAFDAPRTAEVFKAFLATRTPDPQAADPRKELARQVAPGTTKSSSPPAPNAASERIWRPAEIERFYIDVSKGLYQTRQAEAIQIEAEIDAAVASNRVR